MFFAYCKVVELGGLRRKIVAEKTNKNVKKKNVFDGHKHDDEQQSSPMEMRSRFYSNLFGPKQVRWISHYARNVFTKIENTWATE